MVRKQLNYIMNYIITSEQSGFVEGRQIMDGIIVAHEVVHSLETTKIPGMTIKLDFSKAYDFLNWNYLVNILDAFRFSQVWMKWIGSLIETPLYSILVNGSPPEHLKDIEALGRGIQSPPFSLSLQQADLENI